jgi:hypothetical protein
VPAFRLIPLPASATLQIHITGKIKRLENQLSIRYEVQGEMDKLLFPAPTESPTRKDDLWKSTCFEFFIAIQDQPHYWEFNMSPSANWNVYAMDAYRQVNMREESAFTQLPFEFSKASTEYSLDISVDLSPIIQPENILQVGITTIIQAMDGNETCWALAHPGQQADFHLRESFLIEL